MKIFNSLEVNPQEIWDFCLYPFYKIYNLFKYRMKTRNLNRLNNNITWGYKIPRFKLSNNITKDDIYEIRPLCRKCSCELRNDFTVPMRMTTNYNFKFTCPNCHLVHNLWEESLESFFSDLKRQIAFREDESKS